jgi:hypothetical protein
LISAGLHPMLRHGANEGRDEVPRSIVTDGEEFE